MMYRNESYDFFLRGRGEMSRKRMSLKELVTRKIFQKSNKIKDLRK